MVAEYERKSDTFSSRLPILAALDGFVDAIVRLLRVLRLSRKTSPAVQYRDPEKYLQQEVQADVLSYLKRREVLEDEFEGNVMKLLTPLRTAIAEMANVTLPPYHISDLPPPPQLFYGRDEEVSSLVRHFTAESKANVMVLGPEGVGKSAVVLSLFHHPQIVSHYGARRFIIRPSRSHGAATLLQQLALLLGLPVPSEAQASESQITTVVEILSSSPFLTLIALDDLDVLPFSQLGALVNLLDALSAIPRVYVVVASREPLHIAGVESFTSRASVLLLPPLSLSAAQDLFCAVAGLPDIIDGGGMAVKDGVDHDHNLITAILKETRYVPQAIVTVAQLAQYEPLAFLAAHYLEAT